MFYVLYLQLGAQILSALELGFSSICPHPKDLMKTVEAPSQALERRELP